MGRFFWNDSCGTVYSNPGRNGKFPLLEDCQLVLAVRKDKKIMDNTKHSDITKKNIKINLLLLIENRKNRKYV